MSRRASARREMTDLIHGSTPVFLVSARRRFQLFNRGCELETGWTAAEIQEHRADYVTAADPHECLAVAAALAPPPQVWQGERLVTAVDLPHRTEAPRPRLIYFFPLRGDSGSVSTVMGVITLPPPPAGLGMPVISSSLHAELAAVRHELRRQFAERTLVARSPAMLRAVQQAKVAQVVKTPVLIRGEPGTGKEHLARVIHYASASGRRSFVPVDCRLVDDQELKRLLRHLSEERLSGTALAPGTLYFAQLDNAPTEVLQRIAEFATQEQGETALRIIASTTTPLDLLVEDQRFPRDLYYFLTALEIVVPPLRERPEELELLAQLFLEELNRDADQQMAGFHETVLEQFRRYLWPGNLDELRQVVSEARQACQGPMILLEHLPFRFRTGMDAQRMVPRVRPTPVPLDPLLEQVEREQIELALQTAGGNVSQAAELLKIPRARLYRRLQQLKISLTIVTKNTQDETGT